MYMPDEYLLDVDGSTTEEAKEKVLKLILLLRKLKVPTQIYYSGRGFHIGIPGSAFRWKPSKDLHIKVKEELMKYSIYDYADPSVTDKTRIIRCLNTRNNKSGLWKVQLMPHHLHGEIEGILKYAKTSCEFEDQLEDYETMNPPFDVKSRKIKAYDNMITKDYGRNPFNVASSRLQANTNAAANTDWYMDILSNGFQWRDSGGSTNGADNQYIFYAVAQQSLVANNTIGLAR